MWSHIFPLLLALSEALTAWVASAFLGRLVCFLGFQKVKIRKDEELDPREWGNVGWMAPGPPRGLHNLGTFVGICGGPLAEPECKADRAQPSLTNVT